MEDGLKSEGGWCDYVQIKAHLTGFRESLSIRSSGMPEHQSSHANSLAREIKRWRYWAFRPGSVFEGSDITTGRYSRRPHHIIGAAQPSHESPLALRVPGLLTSISVCLIKVSRRRYLDFSPRRCLLFVQLP